MAVGQKWVPKMEPRQKETWAKACGPWWFNFDPRPYFSGYVGEPDEVVGFKVGQGRSPVCLQDKSLREPY